MKRILNVALLGLLLASCGQVSTNRKSEGQSSASQASSENRGRGGPLSDSFSSPSTVALSKEDDSSPSSSRSREGPLSPLPYSVTLDVPFSPQAPSANWDAQHEEACEEMSLILIHHYLEGTSITRDQAEQELQALLRWEEEHGYPLDVTVLQLKEIAEQFYGHAGRVIEDPTANDLKQLLSEGYPVIIPAAGRDLGNPYFSGEGPWYHMLVLKGYNEFFFITNDVGTRRGEGYVYRFDTLLNAIHDWTGVKENIREGVRRVLVIEQMK